LSTAIFSDHNLVHLSNKANLIQDNFSIPLLAMEHNLVKGSNLNKLSLILKTIQTLDTQKTPGIPLHLIPEPSLITNPFSLNEDQTKSVFWGIIGTIIVVIVMFSAFKITVKLGRRVYNLYKNFKFMTKRSEAKPDKMVQMQTIYRQATAPEDETREPLTQAEPPHDQSKEDNEPKLPATPSYFFAG
jgi:Sec-independent protein translocase protein TatA